MEVSEELDRIEEAHGRAFEDLSRWQNYVKGQELQKLEFDTAEKTVHVHGRFSAAKEKGSFGEVLLSEVSSAAFIKALNEHLGAIVATAVKNVHASRVSSTREVLSVGENKLAQYAFALGEGKKRLETFRRGAGEDEGPTPK